MEVGWREVVVTENNLVKAMTQLRQVLDSNNPETYIRTASRLGDRFVATVEPIDAALAEAELDGMLTPYRVLMDGRAATETLERAQIV